MFVYVVIKFGFYPMVFEPDSKRKVGIDEIDATPSLRDTIHEEIKTDIFRSEFLDAFEDYPVNHRIRHGPNIGICSVGNHVF